MMINHGRTNTSLWFRGGWMLPAAILLLAALPGMVGAGAGFGIGGSGFITRQHGDTRAQGAGITRQNGNTRAQSPANGGKAIVKGGKPGYVNRKYRQYVKHTAYLGSLLAKLNPVPVSFETAVAGTRTSVSRSPGSSGHVFIKTILMRGKTYDITVTGLNAGHSHVKWGGHNTVSRSHPRHQPPPQKSMKFTPKISYFRPEMGNWVAHARVSAARVSGKSLWIVEGSITPTVYTPQPGNKEHPVLHSYPPSLPVIVSSPPITRVELMGGYYGHKNKKYNPRSGSLDLFKGSPEVVLFAKFEGGGRPKPIRLPDYFVPVRVQQSPRNALKSLFHTGTMLPAGNRPGKVKIRAVISRKDTLKSGVLMAKPILRSAPLTITINRAYLIKESQFVFRLAIEGPADMSKYRTKWHFYQRGNRIIKHGKFIGKASQVRVWKRRDGANSPLHAASFRYVEIINKHNETVARLNGAGMAAVIAPDITLTVNGGSFVQNMPQIITANITGLPDDIASRTVIKWSFSGVQPGSTGKAAAEHITYGSNYDLMGGMESNTDISYLKRTSGGQYISKMPVIYPESVDTAGKRPVIKAEIILKASTMKGGRR